MALPHCLITAPNCKSEASAQTPQGMLGLGKASITFCEMMRLTALNAVIDSVRSGSPLVQPDEALRGATMSARPSQKARQTSAIPTKDLSSVAVLGKSSCKIGLILSGLGRTPVEVMMWPDQRAFD